MVIEGKYKYLPMSEKTRILSALAEGDYEFMSKRLKKFKITESIFLDMCEVALDNNDQFGLKTLLDLYTIYHTPGFFNKLVDMIEIRNQYTFATFVSDYIDELNESRA